jgi:uncharacterized protein YbjT (DUF2867 family)
MPNPSILVTLVPLVDYPGGVPTEPISRRLTDVLLGVGERVRVLAEGEQADHWPSGVEVIEGSVVRPAEVPQAFDNTSSLFLAGADPATVYDALHMAQTGGAAKVVDLSSHGPDVEIALPPDHWHWLAIEVVVERSGMAWCHVVPPLVMATTLTGSYPLVGNSWSDRIKTAQPIKTSSARARYPFIHEKDLATVIAHVLRHQDYDSKTLHVSGKLISDVERICILRDVLGKDIVCEELSREQAYHEYAAYGMEHDAINYVLDTAEWFAEHEAETYAKTEYLLGRPLTSYADWVREHTSYFS